MGKTEQDIGSRSTERQKRKEFGSVNYRTSPNLLNLLIPIASRLNSASIECLRSTFGRKTRKKSTLELRESRFLDFDE